MATYDGFSLIDTYEFMEGDNVNRAVGRYYVPKASIGNRPSKGGANPGSLAGTWYVERVQSIPQSAVSYIVTIWFRDSVYIPTPVRLASDAELDADFRVRYTMGQFYVSPAVMGLERKGEYPVEIFDKATYKDLSAWIPRERDANNVPITAAQWVATTLVPTGCPFTKKPKWQQFQKRLTTCVAVLYFNATKAGLSSTQFNGVNTSGNISAGFDLDQRTVAGYWRAIDQKTGNIVSRGASAYRPAKRLLMHPPKGGDQDGNHLVWDSAKCGGDFTW